MRAGNSCKKSLSLRKFSVRVLCVFLMIGCWVRPAEAANFLDITVVDSAFSGLTFSSVAVLPSGYPAISYYNVGITDLKYAWYDGTMWHAETVDSAGAVGTATSLTILPSGQPAISYFDITNDDLKYAWYDGTTWQTTTADSEGGTNTSLAILPSGQPAISYYESGNKDLKYAWYNGSTWQTTTVDSGGAHTSLAILPSGNPAISYKKGSPDYDLKYAWYDGSAWQTSTVDSTGDVGSWTSLAILPSGHPAISYCDVTNYDLKYASYDGSAWQTEVVDSERWTGWYTSLAILPSGQPAISYHSADPDDDLKYAWYDGTIWQTTLVDWEGETGRETSLAILPWGEPAISYSDYTNRRLKCALVTNLAPTPVAMDANYTATAWTEYGGTTTVVNGPAYSEGTDSVSGAFSSSSVSLDTTGGGHLMGMVKLESYDEEWCVEWDPEIGCLWWEWTPAGASGTVAGTIELGTSGSYPAGSELELTEHVIVSGDVGNYYEEDYHLKLWRGMSLLGQIDPSAPEQIVVPVLAGETLTFELFASEDSADNSDRGFEFRMILRGPANFDGKGTVDFRDFAIFGLAWKTEPGDAAWDPNCDISDPNDDIIDNNDLDVFTDHWLE